MVSITTYLSLVIGELAPKPISLYNPEQVASLIAPPMAFLPKITSPSVKLPGLSITVVLKVPGIGNKEEPSVSEVEVRILINQGRGMNL